MKKILAVALMTLVFLLAGCSKDKVEETPAVLLGNSFWVADSENIPYLADALARDDVEYLNQLMLEGKVFKVDRDTKVARFGVADDSHFALISFKEGRYTNKSGYAFNVSTFTEDEYQNYLEEKRQAAERQEQERQALLEQERQEKLAQEQAKKDAERQEAHTLIQNCLMNSENYFAAIDSGNESELRQLAAIISDDEKKLMVAESRLNSDVRECAKNAHKIITNRGVSVLLYLQFKTKGGEVAKYHQQAEQSRQEFRNKYGY